MSYSEELGTKIDVERSVGRPIIKSGALMTKTELLSLEDYQVSNMQILKVLIF